MHAPKAQAETKIFTMRIALAIVIAAAGLAGAVYLHQIERLRPPCSELATASRCFTQPAWADPAAVFVAVAGLASAAAVGRFKKPNEK